MRPPQSLGILVLGSALLVGATLHPSPAQATIVEALELSELVDRSDHIVVARVMGIQARYDTHGRIVTDATIRIENRLKGPTSAGNTLVVRRLGGVIGDLGMRVEGEAILRAGERHMLFLRDYGPHCRAIGMSQGALAIVPDATDQLMVQPNGTGLALVRPSASGMIPAPPAVMHPEPLDELIARVRELLRAPTTGTTLPGTTTSGGR